MSKDLLTEATRALRESEPVSDFEARATRARVLAGLHQTRVRRRTRLAFLLPLAASFVAVSAWGAASGKARLVLDQLEHLVGIKATTQSTPRTTPGRIPAPAVRLAASPEGAELTPWQEAAPATVAPSAAPPASSARATSSAPTAPPGRAERLDPTLALYRSAHAAHFVDRDPARALAGWDAYLRAAPSGEFAPEARYNRALSLVRLGRDQEARNALEPFANGAYGSYRKAEASALLARIAP